MLEEYCKLLDVSRNTYYVHKREHRPIIDLLEKYFTAEELREFLETKKINRLEISREIDDELEDFAFKTAIFKIKSTKNLPTNLFFRIFEDVHVQTKLDYTIAMDSIKIDIEHSDIIKEFIENDLSSLEMKMLIKNKNIIKNSIIDEFYC